MQPKPAAQTRTAGQLCYAIHKRTDLSRAAGTEANRQFGSRQFEYAIHKRARMSVGMKASLTLTLAAATADIARLRRGQAGD